MSVDHVKDWVPDEMECPELDAKSLPMRNVSHLDLDRKLENKTRHQSARFENS